MQLIAISDNRAGHLAQMKSVLDCLNVQHQLITLNNSWLGKLGCKYFPLGVQKLSRITLKKLIDSLTSSTLLLVIGRRNLSVSLYLRNQLLKKQISCKIVFLMPPGKYNSYDIESIFYHSYKALPNSKIKNYIPVVLPPSTIANQKSNLNINSCISVAVGGAARGAKWNIKAVNQFILLLIDLQKMEHLKVYISFSRRTELKYIKYFFNKLGSNDNFYFVDDRFLTFREGSADKNIIKATYKNVLNASKIAVVTGESSLMMADAVNTLSVEKVLIYDSKLFLETRFSKLHSYLYNNNYAAPLESYISNGLNNRAIMKHIKLENSSKVISSHIKGIMNG